MFDDIEGLMDRLPRWLKDDLMMQSIADELDRIIIDAYYYMLCTFPRQPLQVWNSMGDIIYKEMNLTLLLGNSEEEDKDEILELSEEESVGVYRERALVKIHNEGMGTNLRVEVNPECCLCPLLNIFIKKVDEEEDLFYDGEICGQITLTENGTLFHDHIDISDEVGAYHRLDLEPGDNVFEVAIERGICASDVNIAFKFEEYSQFNLHSRALAQDGFPLRSVAIFNEGGERLDIKRFKKVDDIKSYTLTVENVPSQRFYSEIYYYGFRKPARKGFPQFEIPDEELTFEENKMYMRNTSLDLIADTMGLFRRKYKDTVRPHLLPRTYPPFYPYEIEQDYWLEKRIMEEYNETFFEHGLLKSEINSYLNVIPIMHNMSDRLLIWEVRDWDLYLWAGGIYSHGVFDLNIPIERIPSNIDLLKTEEIFKIAKKCRSCGTEVIPSYSIEKFFEINMTVNSDVEMEENLFYSLNLYNYLGYECSVEIERLLFNLSNKINVESDRTPSFNITFEPTVFVLVNSLLQSEDNDYFVNQYYRVDYSDDEIKLGTSGGMYRSSGTFMTPSIDKGAVEFWGDFNVEKETLTGTKILFDILEVYEDQKELSTDTEVPLGHVNYRRLKQGFIPTANNLVEIQLKAGDGVGDPHGSIYVDLYQTDALNNIIGQRIERMVIRESDWDGDIKVAFDSKLAKGESYCFVLESEYTNEQDYYTVKAKGSEVEGKLLERFSSNYSPLNQTLFFKTLYGEEVVNDFTGDVRSLNDININIIKIRGKMKTLNNNLTPIISRIKVTSGD